MGSGPERPSDRVPGSQGLWRAVCTVEWGGWGQGVQFTARLDPSPVPFRFPSLLLDLVTGVIIWIALSLLGQPMGGPTLWPLASIAPSPTDQCGRRPEWKQAKPVRVRPDTYAHFHIMHSHMYNVG